MAETTKTGFVNRNEQAVLGPTGIPGNDHLQEFYVLRCRMCGHEYGANGADIWQRQCPECGGGVEGAALTSADVVPREHAGPARNPPWSRDELILALDLYLSYPASPPGKASKPVLELSEFLNRLGSQLGRGSAAKFRNPNGVYMKMMNFRRFDPAVIASGKVGLTRGNKDEEIVWKEYASDPRRLSTVTRARSLVRSAPLWWATRRLSASSRSSLSPSRLRQ